MSLILIAIAGLGVVSLLEQMGTSPGAGYIAIGLANASFFIPLDKTRAVCFRLGRPVIQLRYPVSGHIHSPALGTIVFRNLDHFCLPQIAHWPIALVRLCRLDLVSKK